MDIELRVRLKRVDDEGKEHWVVEEFIHKYHSFLFWAWESTYWRELKQHTFETIEWSHSEKESAITAAKTYREAKRKEWIMREKPEIVD